MFSYPVAYPKTNQAGSQNRNMEYFLAQHNESNKLHNEYNPFSEYFYVWLIKINILECDL